MNAPTQDPTRLSTLVAICALVFVLAGLAAVVPALRATAVDPASALRSE